MWLARHLDNISPTLQAVKTESSTGKVTYPVGSINVLKAHGKSARESALLNGYALNMGRASQVFPSEEFPRTRGFTGASPSHCHKLLALLAVW